MIQAVLFDLDGTLADTAPDLTYALNRVRGARGLPPLPLAATRPVASQGARGLIGAGFGIHPGDPGYDALRDEFLAVYAENLCRETRLFSGIPELLDRLEARALPWGVVTNKAERFTFPLLDLLKVRGRSACVIGGDTTGRIKPHPDPLLAASRAIGLAPQSCIYLGDDRRDVEAGHAAGMKTAIAKWGYLNGQDPENWNADHMFEAPRDLLQIL
ncbi:MAG TPA: HAD-IA family hydrolase [Burkholderiales bacterium]|nr:HAD-IA family hydrolase [Burkholderiales bacterium]